MDGPTDADDPWWLIRDIPARLRGAGPVIAASLPAFAAVAWFVHLWHGLTPPTFNEQYPHGNPAAPVFVVALIGALSPFFIGYLWPGLTDLWQRRRSGALAAGGLGLALALLTPTSRQQSAGRWGGGLWDLAGLLPTVADRSLVISVLAVAGAVSIAGWSRLLPSGARLVVLSSLLAFCTAQTASFEVFERYIEPLVLMVLALLSAAATKSSDSPSPVLRTLRVGGPVALACGLAAVTAVSLSR